VELFGNLKPEIYNAWILASIYFILSNAYVLLFPNYQLKTFVQVPRIKYITAVHYFLYYTFLFFCIFIPLKQMSVWLVSGITIFITGMVFYTFSMYKYAVAEYNTLITTGIYKISRHPVYGSFFLITIGISTASTSGILYIISLLHFITTGIIIKAEEKECMKKFGETYEQYKSRSVIKRVFKRHK
jgi:protein-S-isoprenylcysteine O-methyltransferase Ste14